MNYANTYSHKWNDCRSVQAQTDGFAPKNRRVHDRNATPERLPRNPQRQTAIRSERPFADGFLKSRFLPKLQVNSEQKKLSERQVKQRERDFYNSLSQLAGHYGITPPQTKDFGYPYNLTLACREIEKQLRQSHNCKDFTELRISENGDTGQLFLSVTETYYTGCQFYYVPVVPLFRMLEDPERKQTAVLLLSVFGYLYHIADIPFYRQENSYLYWQYEILKEWAIHDDESEENRKILAELTQAEQIGDQMHTMIFDKENLTDWKRRIKTFRAKDPFDSDVFLMTTKFFQLYQTYPERRLFQNSVTGWEDAEYCYDEEETKITMDKYIGFIADCNGLLYEQLCETVNQEFSQYGEMEEPAVTTHFDGTLAGKESLDFENRIFPLINELCYYLNQYNTQEDEREHK